MSDKGRECPKCRRLLSKRHFFHDLVDTCKKCTGASSSGDRASRVVKDKVLAAAFKQSKTPR